jgi:hypothetical protein
MEERQIPITAKTPEDFNKVLVFWKNLPKYLKEQIEKGADEGFSELKLVYYLHGYDTISIPKNHEVINVTLKDKDGLVHISCWVDKTKVEYVVKAESLRKITFGCWI